MALHSEDAQGLILHKGPVNEGPVISKVLTWDWFGHVEDAWKNCHAEW